MGKGGADAEITQFEAALAAEVSKDVFKFDSFLIYTLGFFFGFLLAIGFTFFCVGLTLLSDNTSYTNWMVFLAGLALGGMGVVGGIAVWQRLWFLLLKVAIACCSGFVFLYVLLIYAYVVSHDVRSPMKEFADTNWRDQSAIATTELDPNYCITNVPLNCFAPLTSTEEETIQAGDSCDTKCKEFWVGEADDAMKPLGWAIYFLCMVMIATAFINNQCLEDDGYDKGKEHLIAFGLNGGLFFFGLITIITTLVTTKSGSNIMIWMILFGMIILGAAGCGAVGVYMDMDWFIRATNGVLLMMFLIMMSLAILTSFYGKNMASVSSFYDDNWDDIKDEIAQNDANLCVDLTEAECKSRFKAKSQKQIRFIAYGVAGVEAFLLVLLWLSVRGVRFWRRTPENEDVNFDSGGDGGDGGASAPAPASASAPDPAAASASAPSGGGKGKKGKKGKGGDDSGKKFVNPLTDDDGD